MKQVKIWLRACWLLILCLFFPAAARAEDAPQVPGKLKLFLLIGQSNMAGRGVVGPDDKVINPHIWMLNKELQWVPAQDPLHFDKPIAGVGLASEFARTLVKKDPTVNIGLVPCAVGGTSIRQWAPNGQFYKDAVARTKEALKQGELAGILWHQGESDVASLDKPGETYQQRFTAMITKLRQDLNAPDVPLVMGELGRYRETFAPFNVMLAELVKTLPHCTLVSSEGLAPKSDNLHFDTPSLHIFGRRYADAYLALQAAK